MEQYCCYRYIVDGEVVYIGRTGNLKQRIHQHKYDLYFASKPTVQYTLCQDYMDSVDMELFLIEKERPELNRKVLPAAWEYEELEWHDYDIGSDFGTMESYRRWESRL